MTRRWAWVPAAVCLVAAAVNTVSIVLLGSPFSVETLANRGFPLVTIGGLVSGLMGSLVLSNHPRHRIGRLLAFSGIVTSLSLAFDAYATWVLDAGGAGPHRLAQVLSWLASALNGNLTTGAFAVIVLLAPAGTLLSRRWRVVVAIAVLGAAMMEIGPFVEPGTYATSDPQPQTAIGRMGFTFGAMLLEVAFLLAVVSVIRRQRRASGVERVQLRWFSAAAVTLAATLAWLVLLPLVAPDGDILVAMIVPFMAATMIFPVAIAIAVLGYRLYDIELILNRAWLFVGATAFVGGAYVVVVATVGTAVSEFWPSAFTAALVACAFQPVRVLLVRVADRLAYGDQAAPYQALADLSRRLGHTPDPNRLLESVAEACVRGTGVAASRADLFHADGSTSSTTVPAGAALVGKVNHFDIRYGEAILGALYVQARPGRALRRRELEVLAGLADQAGVALHKLRLDDVLKQHIAQLNEAAVGLEQSRDQLRRARADQLAHLERSLGRDVAPRLDATCQQIEDLIQGVPPADHPAWRKLASELTVAQDELRRLSHQLRSADR